LAALADDDVQVIATAGGEDLSQIISSKNAMVETYIPYDLVLPKTAVF
jgi:UDP:flavonoid glycosyltransferase YjiC (YdhE family)